MSVKLRRERLSLWLMFRCLFIKTYLKKTWVGLVQRYFFPHRFIHIYIFFVNVSVMTGNFAVGILAVGNLAVGSFALMKFCRRIFRCKENFAVQEHFAVRHFRRKNFQTYIFQHKFEPLCTYRRNCMYNAHCLDSSPTILDKKLILNVNRSCFHFYLIRIKK